MIFTLPCPKCQKFFAVDTFDTKVKCRHCNALLFLEKNPEDRKGEPAYVLVADGKQQQIPSGTNAKLPDYATTEQWRSFVSQKNRDCECGKKIKRYQTAYGLIEGDKVTKVVCMTCNAKTLPPDEEHPMNKLVPKIRS